MGGKLKNIKSCFSMNLANPHFADPVCVLRINLSLSGFRSGEIHMTSLCNAATSARAFEGPRRSQVLQDLLHRRSFQRERAVCAHQRAHGAHEGAAGRLYGSPTTVHRGSGQFSSNLTSCFCCHLVCSNSNAVYALRSRVPADLNPLRCDGPETYRSGPTWIPLIGNLPL